MQAKKTAPDHFRTNRDGKLRTLSILLQSKHIVITENEEYDKPSLLIERTKEHTEGIIGVIDLLSGPYLVIVTECASKGFICDKEIFVIQEIDLVPILSDNQTSSLKPEQKTDEDRFQTLLLDLLATQSFYFSYSYDLSNSMQRYQQLKATNQIHNQKTRKNATANLWSHIDDRFVWNSALQQQFIQGSTFDEFGKHWFVPVIQGFVSIKARNTIQSSIQTAGTPTIVNCTFSFALVSRRDKRRVGTRFHTRGANAEGHVANYAETEQILEYDIVTEGQKQRVVNSYLQIRGSIPIVWTQTPDLQYEPKIQIERTKSIQPCRLHFAEQTRLYEKQVIINLVKSTGSEKALGDAYEATVKEVSNPQVKYVAFDVYRHCGHKNYHKISLLLDQLQEDIKFFSYFSKKGSQVTQQRGNFRSNCKDCLDRTNLMQGIFGKLNLFQQFKDLNLIKNDTDLENTEFMKFFRAVWCDNGDLISVMYAGTPALKRDVTLTGKRTFYGLLEDGQSAVSRYYLNNFQDGTTEDSMNLFAGHYQVTPIAGTNYQSPFAVKAENILVVFLLALLSMLAPRSVRTKLEVMLVMFLTFVIVVLAKILFVSSRKIVNHPRLLPKQKQT